MNHGDLQKRLLFTLHRGLLELRGLALGMKHSNKYFILNKPQIVDQIADLSDILEFIPGCWDSSGIDEARLEVIRQSFLSYKEKHPQSTFDYIRYLDIDEPPDRF